MPTLAHARRQPTTPLLENGFRPFFLGASLWLAFATLFWLGQLAAGWDGASRLDPLAWHQHEMLFGGIGAIVVGFLLTAVPNWTGRLPLRGLPLMGLALWWATARLVNLLSGQLPELAAPLVDGGFLLAVAAFALREVRAGRNWRNLPLVGLVGLLALACFGSHSASLGAPIDGDLVRRFAIAVLIVLIGLVGGRVVPSFTRNWLVKRGGSALPAAFGRFDQASLAALACALLVWTWAPGASPTAWLLVAVGALQLLRLARWQGHRTGAEPLVAILHLGYLWLALGLVVLGLAVLVPALASWSGIHALTAGAIGTMTLAVMTRATLGHTGRALTADRATVVIYALVVIGALVRVVGDSVGFDPLLVRAAAGMLWMGAYVGFAVHYGPMLVRRRADAG